MLTEIGKGPAACITWIDADFLLPYNQIQCKFKVPLQG